MTKFKHTPHQFAPFSLIGVACITGCMAVCLAILLGLPTHAAADVVFCYQEELDLVQEVQEQYCEGSIVGAAEAEAIQARRRDYLRRAFDGAGWRPDAALQLVGVGSGFAVSAEGHIVTNFHVVEDCAAISILTPQGAETMAHLTAGARPRDLALLRTGPDGPARQPVLFAKSQARLALGAVAAGDQSAETVRFLGYPFQGRPPRVPMDQPGQLWRITGAILPVPVIAFRGEIRKGHSGGPLLNQKGRVIGLVFAESNAPAFLRQADKETAERMVNVGLALPFWEILIFLDQADVTYRIARDGDDKAPESAQFMVRVNCWR